MRSLHIDAARARVFSELPLSEWRKKPRGSSFMSLGEGAVILNQYFDVQRGTFGQSRNPHDIAVLAQRINLTSFIKGRLWHSTEPLAYTRAHNRGGDVSPLFQFHAFGGARANIYRDADIVHDGRELAFAGNSISKERYDFLGGAIRFFLRVAFIPLDSVDENVGPFDAFECALRDYGLLGSGARGLFGVFNAAAHRRPLQPEHEELKQRDENA